MKHSKQGNSLRQRAERLLAEKPEPTQKVREGDCKSLLQELQVHQIELEMQNEELRRAQIKIEESRKEYIDLYEFAPLGYFTLDRRGFIVKANLTGAGLLGAARNFLIKTPFFPFVVPEFRPIFHSHFKEAFATGQKQVCEVKLRKKDASIFYALLESIVTEDDRSAPFCRTTVTDITHRKQAEMNLRESESKLHDLSCQLLMVQESERKRVAQELHDSIGQSLTTMKIRLERDIRQMLKGQENANPLWESALTQLKNVMDETRRIMTSLWPSMLDDLGILATLDWFCREFQKTYPRVHIEKRVNLREEEIPMPVKIVIYRVLQESLDNFTRLSRGGRITLSLEKADGAIEFTIEDNGKRFDPESIKGRLGVATMRERTELSGGVFSIKSGKESGTFIRASWKSTGGMECATEAVEKIQAGP